MTKEVVVVIGAGGIGLARVSAFVTRFEHKPGCYQAFIAG